jgi:thiol-disulfide isomerase/thioredoxin
VLIALSVFVFASIGWLALENARLRDQLETLRGSSQEERSLQPGEDLPPMPVVTFQSDGTRTTHQTILADELANTTVIFVFTSSCQYCARSAPLIRQIHQQLGGDAVELVGVALDGQLPAVVAPSSPRTSPIVGYRVFAPAEAIYARILRVPRVPTVLVVDSNGVVRHSWTGEVTEGDVERILMAVRSTAASAP